MRVQKAINCPLQMTNCTVVRGLYAICPNVLGEIDQILSVRNFYADCVGRSNGNLINNAVRCRLCHALLNQTATVGCTA